MHRQFSEHHRSAQEGRRFHGGLCAGECGRALHLRRALLLPRQGDARRDDADGGRILERAGIAILLHR